jgi:hypothetical protein
MTPVISPLVLPFTLSLARRLHNSYNQLHSSRFNCLAPAPRILGQGNRGVYLMRSTENGLFTPHPSDIASLSCLAWPTHRPRREPLRLIDRHCNRTAHQFGPSAGRTQHHHRHTVRLEDGCRLHGQSLHLASAVSRSRTKLLYIEPQPYSAGLRSFASA